MEASKPKKKRSLSPEERERLERQKAAVIRVSGKLVERGLLVRTWGNVSRRYDRDHFHITPTGLFYDDLTTDKIVSVNMRTLSYKGRIRPSSEMNMHAAIYQLREDAGFVIHTHQPYASCVSALGEKDIILPRDLSEMPEMEEVAHVPVADYALAGTKQLAEYVADTVQRNPDCVGALIENHGVVCWGRNEREARTRAEKIEILSYTYLATLCHTELQYGIHEGFSSLKDGNDITFRDPGTPERVRRIHRAIYAKRPDIHAILHNDAEPERIVSMRYTCIDAIFDDFAQIIGASVKIPENEKEDLGKTLSIRSDCNVVFSEGDGAFCLGINRKEAEYAAKILNKGCIAQIALTRAGIESALPHLHSIKMHREYAKRYSKISSS